MNAFRILFMLAAVSILACCTDTDDKGITGKWKNEKEDIVIEFRKDGTFINTEKGRSFRGEYKLLDKSTLLLDVDGKQMKYDINLSGESLKMKDPEGHQGVVALERVE